MSQRSSKTLVRNVIALGGTMFITFLIFRGVAAFNDVLKLFSNVPVVAAPRCPAGLTLLTSAATGESECVPTRSDTPGVVSVGLYIRPEAPKKEPQKPATPPTAAKPKP